MPAIFDLLYREYCRARLAEMRKQLLLRTESDEVPEANFAEWRPDGDRDGGSSYERKAVDGMPRAVPDHVWSATDA